MAELASESAEALLQRVLEADRALRTAQGAFLEGGDEKAQARALGAEIDRLWPLEPSDDVVSRLIRVSDLLTELGGASGARLLLRVLGHADPNVRVAAGEGLVDLGYDRYAEVARAIEAEVDKGADVTALCEVPYLLAELGEPGGVKLCVRLLKHKDPDVVGAAIEGLAQLGDPSVVRDLEPLRRDKRKLTVVEDDPDAAGEVMVADLAGEAIEHLRNLG